MTLGPTGHSDDGSDPLSGVAPFITPSELDAAYVAGFIDGEGTITVHTQLRKTGTISATCNVIIANTHRGVLETIQQSWGGSIYTRAKLARPNHKRIYTLWLGGAKCEPLLRAVLPYLRIKRRHAELVFAIRALTSPPLTHQKIPLSPETRDAREPLLRELRALNVRGVPQREAAV